MPLSGRTFFLSDHIGVDPGRIPFYWRTSNAPVAQLDRASDYESEGRTFESFRARQFLSAYCKLERSEDGLLRP